MIILFVIKLKFRTKLVGTKPIRKKRKTVFYVSLYNLKQWRLLLLMSIVLNPWIIEALVLFYKYHILEILTVDLI